MPSSPRLYDKIYLIRDKISGTYINTGHVTPRVFFTEGAANGIRNRRTQEHQRYRNPDKDEIDLEVVAIELKEALFF